MALRIILLCVSLTFAAGLRLNVAPAITDVGPAEYEWVTCNNNGGFGTQYLCKLAALAVARHDGKSYRHSKWQNRFDGHGGRTEDIESFTGLRDIKDYHGGVGRDIKDPFAAECGQGPEGGCADEYYTKEVRKEMRSLYNSNPKPAADESCKVAFHVRRGDVNSVNRKERFISNEVVKDVILSNFKDKTVCIFSEGKEHDFGELQSLDNVKLKLNGDYRTAFHNLVAAPELVIASSSFSYSAALLNTGKVYFVQKFWHHVLSDWHEVSHPHSTIPAKLNIDVGSDMLPKSPFLSTMVSCLPKSKGAALSAAGGEPSEIGKEFDKIYSQGGWGVHGDQGSTKSGFGSLVDATRVACDVLHAAVDQAFKKGQKHVRILDAPMGDFFWQRPCLAKLSAKLSWGQSVSYKGLDIAKAAVDAAELKRQNESHTGITIEPFGQADLTQSFSEELGTFDVILCNDALMHNTLENVVTILEKFNELAMRHKKGAFGDNGKATYFVVNSYMQNGDNHQIKTGNYRRLDITNAPFNLKPMCGDRELTSKKNRVDEGEYIITYELPVSLAPIALPMTSKK